MTEHAGRVNALLLAGGRGTRLRPLTETMPKCLVPIAGRPLLDYWIDRLLEAEIREARINTHALAEQVRSYIARVNSRGHIHLVESYEPVLLGSAGTVRANADLADTADQVVLIYADNLSNIDLRPLLDFHRTHADPFTMVLWHAPNPRACGIAELDALGRIISFTEKPPRPATDLANAGLYVVDAQLYREIAARRAFDLGFDVLPRLAGRMRGWVWGGYHLDVGTPQALEQARRDAPRFFPVRENVSAGPGPAVFLDRDGTLIKHVHYLADPADVELLPGAADALKTLRIAGFRRVLVTNQSAVGRGIISEARLHEIHAEMNRQLAEQGTSLDGIYYCPDAPNGDDRTVVENPRRKPGPGMLLQAAAELGLELASSWMVGDSISDVLAGLNAGCRSILVGSGKHEPIRVETAAAAGRYQTASDFAAAAEMILRDRGIYQ
ncbi:MAG: HAD-IIIA family hydrolase [Isosphaeraceae bacterium]